MKLSCLALVALTACAGSDPGVTTPRPTATASPEPAPTASAIVAPAESAAPGVQASPHDRDDPDGVRRWTSWNGPTDGTAVTSKKAWVMAPNLSALGADKLSFGSVYPRLVTVEKADAKEVVFSEKSHRYAVPAALALPTSAAGAKKGGIARCSFGGNSVVGRIDAADDKSVTCSFRFIEKVRNEKLTPEEVLPLDGTLAFGAPVHARFAEEPEQWYQGILALAQGDDAWVLLDTTFAEGHPRAGRPLHQVKRADVRVVDLGKPLAVGQPCLAADFGNIGPCKVSKVLDGGLGYEVTFEGGAKRSYELEMVAPAPK